MSGATTYTIVNDVTTIASKLPRFPTLESTAIMRHANSRKLKDYVFRPFYVKSALMWLIANNHLYKDVNIEYTTDQDWNDITASTVVPFLRLSDEDIIAIDESEEVPDTSNDQRVNLTGKFHSTILKN